MNPRVISGSLKGRRIKVPKTNIEPSKDIVKESLFNVLGNEIIRKSFVDLFAGSGNVGIEALSRLAGLVTFVESCPAHARIIRENLALFQLEAEIVQMDVMGYLKKYNGMPADYIFMDPPYRDFDHDRLLRTLSESKVLKPESLIILEHHEKQRINFQDSSLVETDLRKYGSSALRFMRLMS
ncbi:MAG: 16S rRNA (guanine(966)-N(2))-methyltransferase RsmD [Spirochaetota bacterium]|nr:16S rRNA (guanine(966)-N(2))-methyltransferase RsmD [Spirochaetota bacterium]